jgi:hypothetical protein
VMIPLISKQARTESINLALGPIDAGAVNVQRGVVPGSSRRHHRQRWREKSSRLARAVRRDAADRRFGNQTPSRKT